MKWLLSASTIFALAASANSQEFVPVNKTGLRAILQGPVETDQADKKPAAPLEFVPAPTDPFAGPWTTWPKMTGDWFGRRKTLAEQGITFDASMTQFYQGVTTGGRQNDWAYGARLDYLLNVDGEKAGLWKGFFVTMHAETRFGRDVNGFSGALLPINTGMFIPLPNQDITTITSLKFTQALSEKFVVFLGKINTLDEFQLNFTGGNGTERFMNMSMIFNPIMARTVPYSTYGAGFAVLKDLQPVFSFMALDPEDRPDYGPAHPFQRGVVLMAQGSLPIKPFGLPGHQIFGGVWSSASYTELDRGSYFLIPGQGIVAPNKAGSWALYYAFDQYLWVDPCNPKRGWGAFGQVGISDGNPNPLRWAASVGLGGSSPLRSRPLDAFGAGYFYLGPSDDFKNLFNGPILNPILGQRDGHGIELFYNIAVTPWCHLTTDLQVVQPGTQRFNNAIVPGIRLKVDF